MMADMVKNLALLLMEKNRKLTMEQALSFVFNSDTYQKVMNEEAAFYYQSPKYVLLFGRRTVNRKGRIRILF